MATQQELAVAVLEELATQDSHQEPSAEDAAAVLRRYTRKLVNLTDENLADWTGDAIPDGAMTGLTKIIVYECRNLFGANVPRTHYEEGMRDLGDFMRERVTYEPVRADYF